jgi:hypothetical protein
LESDEYLEHFLIIEEGYVLRWEGVENLREVVNFSVHLFHEVAKDNSTFLNFNVMVYRN